MPFLIFCVSNFLLTVPLYPQGKFRLPETHYAYAACSGRFAQTHKLPKDYFQYISSDIATIVSMLPRKCGWGYSKIHLAPSTYDDL